MDFLKRFPTLSLILAAGLVLAGCGRDEGRIYGKIGFSKITQKDLDKTLDYLTRISPMSRSQYEGDEGLQKLIERHMEDEVAYLDAVKKGYGRDSSITKELDTYKKYLILKQYEQDELMAKAGIPEKDFQAYYGAHKEDYKLKAKVLAKHIQTDTEENAKGLLKEIRGGKPFDEVAETRSLDAQTSKSKGRLGWITEGAVIPYLGKLPEFNDWLFTLKKGVVSGPFKTSKGWHLVLLEDIKPARYKTLDEVRAQIRDEIIASDDNLKEYFEKHAAEFADPEERQIRHILCPDQATADKVLAQLKKGSKFTSLVKRYSTCPGTKNNGGEIGFIRQGRYIPHVGQSKPVEDAVFALNAVNDLTKVIKTDKGYHVFQLMEIKPAKPKTFDQAKFAVRTKLLESAKQEGRAKMLKALEQEYGVSRAASVKDVDVYGKIGRKKITQHDLDESFAYLSKVDRTARETYTGSDSAKVRLLDKHIEMEVIYQDGLAKGYEKHEKIAGELEKYKRYMVLKAYNQQEIEGKAGLTDKQLKNYYNGHKDEYRVKGRILARHILCKTEADAKAVLQEIKNGAEFEDLVASKSIDTQTNKNKGSLGWINEGGHMAYIGTNPAFNAAVFKLQEGEISDPIKTDKGWHLVKADKVFPGHYKSLKEVQVQVRDALLVSDNDIKEYYDKHQQEYVDPEQRSVSHILCKSEAAAKRVRKLLRQGADWDAMAKKYSEDSTTKDKGGLLSYIKRNSYIRSVGREPSFEKAAFSLKEKGDISDVVKTAKGYHIIKLNDLKSRRQKPVEEVTALIRSKVLSEKRNEGVKEAKDTLKRKYRVVLYEIQRTEKELFDMAQKALEDKKYDKAITYYERITKDYPKSDRAYQAIFLVGWVYSEYLKDYDKADVYFKEVLAKYPDSDLSDDADWMIKNQRNPNALDFIIKKADSTRAAQEKLEEEKAKDKAL